MDQAERSYASAMALAERLRLPEVMRAVSQAYAQHAMFAGDMERAAHAAARRRALALAGEQQVPVDPLVAPASAALSF